MRECNEHREQILHMYMYLGLVKDQSKSVHTSVLEHRSMMCAWETPYVVHQAGFIVRIIESRTRQGFLLSMILYIELFALFHRSMMCAWETAQFTRQVSLLGSVDQKPGRTFF